MNRLILPALMILSAAPALAHPGHHHHDGSAFGTGFVHPMLGADHILAMIAVGLWAASLGGRAVWTLPTSFVGAMVVGFGLALGGFGLPLVEPMILGSVFVLGLALALALRLPVGASAALVALFGLFHGHAHGQEMGDAGALTFGTGFALATALLHAAGVALGGIALRELSAARGVAVLRGLGAITLLGGVAVALS